MTIFLILAPFASFALLMLVTSAAISLFAGAAIAAAIIGYEVSRGRSIKMLAAGAVIMFSALGGYISLIDGDWSATEVRLAVDIGTLAIALASIAIRAPFTLQYAREVVDRRNDEDARLHARQLHHHLGVDRRVRADVDREPLDDLYAQPAVLGRARHRVRRPQQRGLFHQMVSGVSAGEVWYSPASALVSPS